MILLFLMAAAPIAAAAAPVPQPADDLVSARRVIEAQLQSAPRPMDRPALSADEADAIHKRYLASIGERLPQADDRQ